MGLFSHDCNSSDDIDFDRLRRDLVDEYGAQSAAFSGGFGFLEMCDAEEASNEQLLEMARREVINITRYKKLTYTRM